MAGSITSTVKSRKGLGIVRLQAAITVDASGNATATSIGAAFGRIVGLIYDADTLDTGADITISDGDTGAAIITLTNAGTSDLFIRPTAVITTNAGAAVSASTSANDVNRDIFVAGPIKVAVAQGGVSMSGKVALIVQEG
jgi:uncharacterized membrane protein